MSGWRGKLTAVACWLVIAALIVGGLGWATAEALRLERLQLEASSEAELAQRLRLALWRLDSRVFPALSQETGRSYQDYSAIYAPTLTFDLQGQAWESGTVLEPSPLLEAELPDWIMLHFQIDAQKRLHSPQVLSPSLAQRLQGAAANLRNVTPRRREAYETLRDLLMPQDFVTRLQERPQTAKAEPSQRLHEVVVPVPAPEPPKANFGYYYFDETTSNYGRVAPPEFGRRVQQQQDVQALNKTLVVPNNSLDLYEKSLSNGENWFTQAPARGNTVRTTQVQIGPLMPLWLNRDGPEPDTLLLARLVSLDGEQVCQGLLLDWVRLRELLEAEVRDLFPSARLRPSLSAALSAGPVNVRSNVTSNMVLDPRLTPPAHPERTMAALPIEMDTGPTVELQIPLFTPLRIGLLLSWLAASVALVVTARGGWLLLDLAERRIRFVSAVTHELRTPLTTLRLYLDLLSDGLVRDEATRQEYFATLQRESERLQRLISNVLDYSRLENQRPQLEFAPNDPADLLEQVRATWEPRGQDVSKQLVIENACPEGTSLRTDGRLVQQILGNLVDNACKYSREADDPRIWVRAKLADRGTVIFEVEDAGPGVPTAQRRSIFRPFQRGGGTALVVGGAGLGLALAQRWSRFLRGQLSVSAGANNRGAKFTLQLPPA